MYDKTNIYIKNAEAIYNVLCVEDKVINRNGYY